MSEKVKNKFTWDDLDDTKTFIPCQYCGALAGYPVCEDGATSSACNHCAYNIVEYCRTHNVE